METKWAYCPNCWVRTWHKFIETRGWFCINCDCWNGLLINETRERKFQKIVTEIALKHLEKKNA